MRCTAAERNATLVRRDEPRDTCARIDVRRVAAALFIAHLHYMTLRALCPII